MKRFINYFAQDKLWCCPFVKYFRIFEVCLCFAALVNSYCETTSKVYGCTMTRNPLHCDSLLTTLYLQHITFTYVGVNIDYPIDILVTLTDKA